VWCLNRFDYSPSCPWEHPEKNEGVFPAHLATGGDLTRSNEGRTLAILGDPVGGRLTKVFSSFGMRRAKKWFTGNQANR